MVPTFQVAVPNWPLGAEDTRGGPDGEAGRRWLSLQEFARALSDRSEISQIKAERLCNAPSANDLLGNGAASCRA